MFVVQKNQEIVMQNLASKELSQYLMADKNERVSNVKQLFQGQEDKSDILIASFVENIMTNQTVLSANLVLKNQRSNKSITLIGSPSLWKNTKVVILSFLSNQEKIVEKKVEVEKVVEKPVEVIKLPTQSQINDKVQEKIECKRQKLQIIDTVYEQFVQPTATKSQNKITSQKKKRNFNFQSPDLSPIQNSSMDEDIQVNLNVDNEVKKNFKFMEVALQKAMEKIVSQIKSYKGKKLNIQIKNKSLNNTAQKEDNLKDQKTNVTQISGIQSPQSAIQQGKRGISSSSNSYKIDQYANFRTPGNLGRKLDRLSIQKKKEEFKGLSALSSNNKYQSSIIGNTQNQKNQHEYDNLVNEVVGQQNENFIIQEIEQKEYSQSSNPLLIETNKAKDDSKSKKSNFLKMMRNAESQQFNYTVSPSGSDCEKDKKEEYFDSQNQGKRDSQNYKFSRKSIEDNNFIHQQIKKKMSQILSEETNDLFQKNDGQVNNRQQNNITDKKQKDNVQNIINNDQNFDQERNGRNSKSKLSPEQLEEQEGQEKYDFLQKKIQIQSQQKYIEQQNKLQSQHSKQNQQQNLIEIPQRKPQKQQNLYEQNGQIKEEQSIKYMENQQNKIGKYCQPQRLLCVDDSSMLMMQLGYMKFGNREIKRDFAQNGLKGYQKYLEYAEKNELYHIIFMDNEMPIMGGLEATKKIRQFENDNNLKAVYIVGIVTDLDKIDKNEYLKAGMNDVIEKPLNPNIIEFYLQQVDQQISEQQEFNGNIQNQEQVQNTNQDKNQNLIPLQNSTPLQLKAEIQLNNDNNTLSLQGEFDGSIMAVADGGMIIMQFPYFPLKNKVQKEFSKSGDDALLKIKNKFEKENKIFYALFIDQSLKGKNGDETIRVIRNYERSNNLRPTIIVLMVSDIDKVNQEELKQLGANHIIEKPLKALMIDEAIQEAMNSNIQEQHQIQNENEIVQSQINGQELKGVVKEPYYIMAISDSGMMAMQFSYFKLNIEVKRVFERNTNKIIQLIDDLFKKQGEIFSSIFIEENLKSCKGIEIVQKIREYEKQNQLKESIIVLLTSDLDKANKNQLIQDGASFVIEKPLTALMIEESVQAQQKQ